MHQCPQCENEHPYVSHVTEEGVDMKCPACQYVWELATVPEPYLRELIARSLELAALKARAVQ